MIFTRTWLGEFLNLENKNLNDIVVALNSIGIEVDSTKSLKVSDKVVVGFVKEKTKHENATKLNVCKVDIGDEDLQIVCGASNVDEGQFVAVALEGAKIGDMTIKKTKLRGVDSEGMICSSTELGFEKINDGIMILDDSIGVLELGKQLNAYPTFNDDFIEVELTPNRGDCLSVYGVARDLAAYFNENLQKRRVFLEPNNTIGVGRVLRLNIDNSLNSIFNFRVVEFNGSLDIPLLLKLRLASIGSLKDDDILNYFSYATHSTGVIFNAYDFNNLAQNEDIVSLNISKLENGESVITCNDETVSVTGIYQEEKFSINKNTKLAVIEAHYTFPEIVALAKDFYKKQDLETIYRSFRGSETDLEFGVSYLLSKMTHCPNISIYTSSHNIGFSKDKTEIKINVEKICKTIGAEIGENDIIDILKRLGFEIVVSKEGHLFSAKVPYYRYSDIKNLADICEEIVRMIGIDNIQAKRSLVVEKNRLDNSTYKTYKKVYDLKQRSVLNGYFESIHYVLDSKEELKKLGFETVSLELLNPITQELNSLRTTLINHLLNSASFNLKNSKKTVKLFESGSVFDSNANESAKMAFISCAYKEEAKISNRAKPALVDFYTFLTELRNILGDFQLKNSSLSFLSPYEQAFIYKNGIKIGFVGRLHLALEKERDLFNAYICEFSLDKFDCVDKVAHMYSKFPSVSRDLSILTPKDFGYEKIKECIKELNIDILTDFRLVDIYSDESLKDKYSITINFIFQDMNKTLEDSEIVSCMDKIITVLKDKLGLSLR
ncbi:phenylalanine--tRNA ligase subunit beta [uncultured Campylobacter sp.]|uniref:phenylalanine--tRNA ligase subunit beta n=1 Tax=uncultured Campylobacter sp. TaxID=218934 RepID=UPI00262464E0|nr:phenylalanine--tRNA ligase subunit beta [uncultured Campylobacter sp.]